MANILRSNSGSYIFVSDLQMPYEHKKALEFCKYVKSHYHIPDENVYCVGDENDSYYGGMWKKDVNAKHTATQEITETIEKMRPWYDAFPKMKLARSNHGERWQRKALDAEIPQLLMKRLESVLNHPKGWVWQKRWLINSKYPMIVEHGDRAGGATPHMKLAELNACSTIIGHHHSKAGINFVQTNGVKDGCLDESGYKVWGMVTGCLIDFEQYAFNYAREYKHKPMLGVGLAFDQGRIPFWLPME